VLPAPAAALSLWLPWVYHRAAALVLTGLDLPDFVRFMGAAGAPLVRPLQVAFALPLLAAAATLAIAVWSVDVSVWFRAAALAVGVWLVSAAVSPLERTGEFALAAAVVIGVWLAAAVLRPPAAIARWTACLTGMASGLVTLWQFAQAAPAMGTLYGHLTWGVGPWVAAGSVLLGAGVAVTAIVPLLRVRRQRTVS